MLRQSLADAAALQAAVSELVRVYQFRDRDHICCHDISVTQCYALEALVLHGPMRLGALARMLFLDKSTASRVVQALVRKRYAKHQRDPQDRRAMALTVTAAGRRLHDRIDADLVGQQERLMADLSPEIRSAVVNVIRRLATAADARFRSGVSVGAQPGDACCGGQS